MYLERLHWEAAVDRAPEKVALELRDTGYWILGKKGVLR